MKFWSHLKVEVVGLNQDILLLQLQKNNIEVENLKRDKHSRSSFVISQKQFKKAKHLGLFERFDVKTKHVPSFANYLWQVPKRIGLVAGVVIVLAFCLVAKNYCFKISIDGANDLQKMQIYDVLDANNTKVGTKWQNVNIKQIEGEIFAVLPDLTNVVVERKGAKLLIRVSEATLSNKHKGDIVAPATCKIEKLEVTQGEALAKEGDIVFEGQTIVRADETLGFCAANVDIRLFCQSSVLVRDFETKPVRTGKSETKSCVVTFWEKLPQTCGTPPYEMYESQTTTQNCFENLFLPYTKVTTTWYELALQPVSHDEALEAARQRACALACQSFEENSDVFVTYNTHEEKGQIFVDCFAELVLHLK